MLPLSSEKNQPKAPSYITVSEVSQQIRATLEGQFSTIRIRGEVSGTTYHGSGHLYFSVKDENAALDVVMWRHAANRLAVKLEDGLDIIITGAITTFAGRSKYQLNATSIEISGDGSLLKLLEERKKKLRDEGLFDPERKKSLPFLPQTIGVISSPTGAVIRDILHRIEERGPTRVILWPAAVQGEKATNEIITAIHHANDIHVNSPNRPDVLILARGGGSIEDLWCFNDEELVRTVANSHIPIISAVGHETDTTLVDYASDMRAPTPTAAAEFAVPVHFELRHTLNTLANQLHRTVNQATNIKRQALNTCAKQLEWGIQRTGTLHQRLDDLSRRLRTPDERLRNVFDALNTHNQRMIRSTAHIFNHKSRELKRLQQVLESYSYTNTLKRGFAVVRDQSDTPVTSSHLARKETNLTLEFHDGKIQTNTQGQTQTYEKTRPKRTGSSRKSKTQDLFSQD